MNIAVCEDEEQQRMIIKDLIAEWNQQTNIPVSADYFSSGEHLLASWDAGSSYDIVFLDIHLNGMDGMKAAKKIRERDELLTLVFLTSRIEYVLKGYEVNAWRYLIKPVHSAEFFQCLNKAKKISDRGQQMLMIHSENRYYKVPFGSVWYIESYGHYVTIHTNDRVYEMRAGITQMEAGLPDNFFRCHRSYLINLDYVKAVEEQQVKVGEDWISISVKKRTDLLKYLKP